MIRAAAASLVGVACLGAAVLFTGAVRGEARDFGQLGQTFPVIEADLLSTIEARLQRAQATGEMDRFNATFAKRVEAKVRRPVPVAGITPAEQPRAWNYDPSITLEREIRDHKGQVIAQAGQRINPLDFVSMRQSLVFVDGDDPAELAWATRRFSELNAKIIFVNGSPIDSMTARKRRFFFDQDGRLTAKFGIRHTPAVVSQAGNQLRVSETVIESGTKS
ncbi:type-F conjugative transfer system protein TraW [Sphingomonas beigongshangi]|uniref:type-F conjugative transfer system protein TraW n=1 Tax=Sphingomonas beigongshangi TaxID=2782540 RepID=UPI001AEEDD27